MIVKKLIIPAILLSLFALLCACRGSADKPNEVSNDTTESSALADRSECSGGNELTIDNTLAENSAINQSDDIIASNDTDNSAAEDSAVSSIAFEDDIVSSVDNSNVTYPEDDSSSLVSKDDSSASPSQDDSSVVPPKEDPDITAPKEDSSVTPPKDDSSTVPPKDDSSVTPPKDDSSTVPPKDDSSIAPPQDDSSAMPPVDDSSATPPIDESSEESISENAIIYDGKTITTAGEYVLKGSIKCPVLIDTTEKVTLILSNATLKATNSPAIYVMNAKKVKIQLIGTNAVSDSSTYASEYSIAKAAIFSEDSLEFFGQGSLTVTGNYKHAIASDDDIVVESGNITVLSAVTDGAHVNDSFELTDGSFTVKNAGSDGIQSESLVMVSGGTLDVKATGNGIKASNNTGVVCDISISGGTVKVDSTNDAMRSNDTINITSGNVSITSENDGMQSDVGILIGGGIVKITCANDGIKSKIVDINDGDIYVKSEDDGVNASLGVTGSVGVEEGVAVTVNGGKLYINAGGDGLDSNGSLEVNGGYIAIDGPTSGLDGVIDVEGTQKINGGVIVGCDSGDMLDSPDSASKQCTTTITGQIFKAGTSIAVTDSKGNLVLCYTFTEDCSAITFSAPALKNGSSYSVYTGVTAKGIATVGGLYYGSYAYYTGGALLLTFTQSSVVTVIN